MSETRRIISQGVTDALPRFLPAIPFALVLGIAILESGVLPLLGWFPWVDPYLLIDATVGGRPPQYINR